MDSNSNNNSSKKKNKKQNINGATEDSIINSSNYDFSNGGNENSKLGVEPKELEDLDEKYESTSRLNMVLNLLKTIKAGIGADLSHVELPGSFILPMSTLKYFNDIFLKNFDLLLKANKIENESERMLEIFKYLNTTLMVSQDPTRKPLNPILGEVLMGDFHVKEEDGNISTDNHYCIEQVSHHPPLSAVAVYNKKEGIRLYFTSPVQLVFAGTYFKIGFGKECEIHFEKYNQTYKIIIPTLCARYLRGFAEYCGVGSIHSDTGSYYMKTQYYAKPLLGGQYNCFESYMYNNKNEKIYKLQGGWSSEVKIKDLKTNETKSFYKNTETSVIKRNEDTSLPTDSSNVWKGVFDAHHQKNLKQKSIEKRKVEKQQRQKLEERNTNNIKWEPKHFTKNNDFWEFNNY
ncbi:hypothetical protein DICPUDRAFT_44602 [Dictyostelium purpureum]|uniref:Oxysterol-binding protein n=1 Tax=Dictyostelium purpureum TaxID=5786 RepID=F0Z6P4_DICPU|nr:uncharacterized protein DICPUDRAFT_44602 [Dictyostelium purpureum]EGC40396.1 hypothetical protein DICPUDRAFT_44602 [Dictyostelium purpureum]|eukprot:XP_003283147.1 hypothetical protein DICPUDRAFT_44602 [Dictyostelium purpureum]